MTHIGLEELGFDRAAIGFITGQTETLEIDIVSLEEFTLMTEEEQAYIVRIQCLGPEHRSGGVSDQEHATAETETSEKETIMNQSTATFDSEKLALWQVQALASTVVHLDPSQDVTHLMQELDAWRGTKTLDKLCDDLVNVLRNVLVEIDADEVAEQSMERDPQPFNARTTERLSFSPVRGVSISDKRASWPAKSYVRAEATPNGKFNLHAWVDVPTSGPADYVRRNVSRSEFVMED